RAAPAEEVDPVRVLVADEVVRRLDRVERARRDLEGLRQAAELGEAPRRVRYGAVPRGEEAHELAARRREVRAGREHPARAPGGSRPGGRVPARSRHWLSWAPGVGGGARGGPVG